MEESLVLTFKVPLEHEDDLTGFLLVTVNVQGTEERSDGLLDVYIAADDWNDDVEAALRSFMTGFPGVELLEVKPLEIRDWNAEWESSIEPVQVTKDLVITPSWKLEDAAKLAATHTIVIDPKMSFGTGHHETTRLCLRAIETLDVTELNVLDVGTGSGVLAFYALKRGALHSVAIDTDQWAIENVAENQKLNLISSDQFELRKGELEAVVAKDETFDLIIANIHRNVLLEIATGIKSRTSARGHIILSGLLIYDADDVRSKYESAGFIFKEMLQENEWIALLMQTNLE